LAKHLLGQENDFAPGTLRRVEVDSVWLCIARLEDGTIRAICDACTHEGASLSEGEIVGNWVECPDHGSLFDLTTGEVTGLPAQIPAQTYQVAIENGEVVVEV